MRVLVDVVHLAQMHFVEHVIRKLDERGHVTPIAARPKDETTDVLDSSGLTYETLGRSGKRNPRAAR